uniref:Uncharacterized protein n=1 Tax=Hemiselmis andersenii TaxID=464988 RepID=A0A6U4Z3J5_HEMAN|mmetsp:Transcript_41474/g.101213  ORF Transcript_41474/g.101213 Transcript_41474/m.101213 type:complete len:276 (+) Transcript_41474:41-868(+)
MVSPSPYSAVVSPDIGDKRRTQMMQAAVCTALALAAVVCVGLVVHERGSGAVGREELGGAYYAVAKPPAFNFNRFIRHAWVYDGRAADPDMTNFVQHVARKHHYKLQIHHLTSFRDNAFRAALFSENIHCIVFPPLVHFPGVSELAAKDLRGYVSAGNNAVFIGSYNWLSVMNDVFGFQLMSDYKDGPYYRNDRNVRGTPFQWSMNRLQQPDGSVYGVKVDSIPMDGKCMFDTMGACVVFYIKYNLGTVTYIAFDYDTPYGIDHWDQILHAGMMM